MHSPFLSSHLVSNKHLSSVHHKLQSNYLQGLFPQDIMSPFLKCLSQLRITLWCHGLDLLQLAYHIHLCYSNSSTGSSSLLHFQLHGHHVRLLLFGNLLLLRHIQILYRTHGTGLL
ncbi:50S ribosomal protein L22 [Dissostichus eleginoides]|uniref:50S ribosomal protein L22 n=1 Tax=Dissostichus eleginoides TaxID=100907 RepID=A0AAD9FBF3_DISEL|nr:50S ribosomal protein L22 [Dissostichus eleginoides]